MDELTARLLETIRINRISTTEIADCLGKSGALTGLQPLTAGYFRAGPVFFAYARDESNYELHEQLREAPAGSIVVIEAPGCNERAVFGSLVSKFLMLYRQCTAIVACATLRDAPRLLKERWPIWCRGVTPIGCFNTPLENAVDRDWLTERRAIYDGALAVCDDSGVVIIPKAVQNEAFAEKLRVIEWQEDAWFFCIDTLKWDTYRTVCQKEYLNDPGLMRLLSTDKAT